MISIRLACAIIARMKSSVKVARHMTDVEEIGGSLSSHPLGLRSRQALAKTQASAPAAKRFPPETHYWVSATAKSETVRSS